MYEHDALVAVVRFRMYSLFRCVQFDSLSNGWLSLFGAMYSTYVIDMYVRIEAGRLFYWYLHGQTP